MIYIFMGIIIVSELGYQFSLKLVPNNVNMFFSLAVSYFIAMLLSISGVFILNSKFNIFSELKTLNWTSILLGISIVGVEAGYFLSYKKGGEISIIPTITMVSVIIILAVVGACFFKEHLGIKNIIGLVLGIIGIALLSVK